MYEVQQWPVIQCKIYTHWCMGPELTLGWEVIPRGSAKPTLLCHFFQNPNSLESANDTNLELTGVSVVSHEGLDVLQNV